ncbi:glutaredoxin domain-containing protein [Pelotalea chapellei]|uniref:NrdH-redoxin n=1 Tax=Pelotalea chapellei TaxID=44671 RepID=A0ABS5UBG2_9BACT|nr:glutaredoxin domain-containing protein [Pelotalea chapellei]MBT1073032.1 NrdH-redoxin [Pelotalea chapellei]
MNRILMLMIIVLAAIPFCVSAQESSQSTLSPSRAETSRKYPNIVLYSVSWCPHCREAKEYFTRNNIPFTNRDVEMDEKAMTDLTVKYESSGVPVVVIGSGSDEVVMKGFTPEKFQKNLQKVQAKKH